MPVSVTAIERAHRAQVQPLPGFQGGLLAKLIVLLRELQADAGEKAFICPVKLAMHFLQLTSLAHASGLLRSLEYRGILYCVKRGTATRGDVQGTPTLWRFIEPKE